MRTLILMYEFTNLCVHDNPFMYTFMNVFIHDVLALLRLHYQGLRPKHAKEGVYW